jgi:hypothetical protein
MSSFELASWSALWALFGVLVFLIYVAFRQIERAQRTALESPTTLGAGTRAPEIKVLDRGEMLRISHPEGEYLLAFVTTSCAACHALLKWLAASELPLTTTVVVNGNDLDAYLNQQHEGLKVVPLVNPGDANHYYKVNVVPTVYLIRDGIVAGATTDGSESGILRLIDTTSDSELETAVATTQGV